jgi:hypothetical protein
MAVAAKGTASPGLVTDVMIVGEVDKNLLICFFKFFLTDFKLLSQLKQSKIK